MGKKKLILKKKVQPTTPPETADQTEPEYKVGYGKPPKHTQFKPGQSGNPKGKPKGAKNIETILKNELYGKVQVTVGGKKKKLTKFEVAMKQMMEKAAKGDLKALGMLLSLAKEYVATAPSSAQMAPPTSDELAILEDVVAFEKMLKDLKGE